MIERKKGPCFKWTPEEDAVIRRHYQKGGADAVAELLPNRGRYGIQQRASRLGVHHTASPYSAMAMGIRADDRSEDERILTAAFNSWFTNPAPMFGVPMVGA